MPGMHDPSYAIVACDSCGATVRVPLTDDTLECPQQSQIIGFLTNNGWTVLMKGFRIECFCPDHEVIIEQENG